jgi:alkylation response protein AidB-like acyl-CoA dehydrogenase
MTKLEKIGNHCSLSYDIGFDEVIVPDSARIGAEGRGFDALKKTLFFMRVRDWLRRSSEPRRRR